VIGRAIRANQRLQFVDFRFKLAIGVKRRRILQHFVHQRPNAAEEHLAKFRHREQVAHQVVVAADAADGLIGIDRVVVVGKTAAPAPVAPVRQIDVPRQRPPFIGDVRVAIEVVVLVAAVGVTVDHEAGQIIGHRPHVDVVVIKVALLRAVGRHVRAGEQRLQIG
jgi:hypothetical protein